MLDPILIGLYSDLYIALPNYLITEVRCLDTGNLILFQYQSNISLIHVIAM